MYILLSLYSFLLIQLMFIITLRPLIQANLPLHFSQLTTHLKPHTALQEEIQPLHIGIA